MKLYLDMCVYNRPFDDQIQPRIMLETQIFVMLLLMISEGRFELLSSFALEYENSMNPNIENMLKISGLLGYSADYVSFDEGVLDRSLEFEKYGLMGIDALHIACAEKAEADFFVTCDDKLIKKLKLIDNIPIAFHSVIDFVSKEVFRI